MGGLSFRSLLSFFLRPSRGSYNSPDSAVTQWTPYYRLLYQSFLLGLDYHAVVQKHEARTGHEKVVKLALQYKQDKELREFYLGEKNPEIELATLRERIAKLQDNLSAFAVAKDYGDRQTFADELHIKSLNARNEEAILDARLVDIELALSTRPDVTPERVARLYAEAKLVLPDAVTKRLGEMEAFHERLRENRLRRLEQDKKVALAERQVWRDRRTGWQADLDGLLQYLRAHKALDEYTENNRFLSELTGRARKIEDYMALLARYTDEAQRIRAEMGQATVQTTE